MKKDREGWTMKAGTWRRLFFRGMVLAMLVLCACAAAESGDVWAVTQYVDVSGNQAMCYSLENQNDGTLILIDGGWDVNAEQVRQVMDAHGGHVNAWFLTHYHPDHIGAFNALWEEYRDGIDAVYVCPIDWETYEPLAHEWDNAGVYADFLEKTRDADNIVALHRDDELEIDGLAFRIFNAFDEHVRELSTDWLNDCSLVIKVSGKENSFLFLADLSRAGVPLGQYLIDTYGAEALHADYVQGGHHGNWGMPVSFYEQIRPGELFFDAPEWVMTGETYDAKNLLVWCHENGIVTHDYRDGGATVYLR